MFFNMIFRKIIAITLLLSFLSGCAQNAALLGPAYTIATSGNVYHAGFTYGSNELITRKTGKSAAQNFKDALNNIRIGGFKLGFWFAQQGSIYVFVILIFIYVRLMNKLDKKYGYDE